MAMLPVCRSCFLFKSSAFKHEIINKVKSSIDCFRNASKKVRCAATSLAGEKDLGNEEFLTNKYAGSSVNNCMNLKVTYKENHNAGRWFILKEAPVLHDATASAVIDINAFKCNSDSGNDSVTPSEYTLNADFVLSNARLTIKEFGQDLKEYNYYNSNINDDIVIVIEPQVKSVTTIVGGIHPDALDWRLQKVQWQNLPKYYASLSKSRLTGLVVMTALSGYIMAPLPLEVSSLVFCCVGTALMSCAANTLNQFMEVPFDSQMSRTKNRVLVQGSLTPLHAVTFGVMCGVIGISLLYTYVSELTALLGAFNLMLYVAIYTPMKRMSIVNTWLGSVVGAVPPLMGWSGCTGGLELGSLVMAGILYAWQFPHFNALSWNLRPEYSRAGYRMMAVTDPGLCRRTALRYSAAMVLLCTLAPVCELTSWTFAFDSLPVNGYLLYLAWKFHENADSQSSRKLFRFSLIHLPLILMLMMIGKKYRKSEVSHEGAKKENVNVVNR